MFKKTISVIVVFVLALSLCANVSAASVKVLDDAITDSAEYIYKTVKTPQVGSIGGEWAVLGLARSGFDVPDTYYDAYYQTVCEYVKACGGVLHDKKYTEYARLTLGLTAAGYDARDVAGYDLTYALGDFEKTIWQGINGPIFALIALDSGNYPVPVNTEAKTQATRELYVAEILRRQLNDGGFSLTGGTTAENKNERSDPDLTGMALQALAKYRDKPEVDIAVAAAVECLSSAQDNSGGFSSWGTPNSESTVQVLVALGELEISVDDPRFVKNGISLLDNLLTYYTRGAGFKHTADGSGSNQMAAEQGLYGLVSVWRASNGLSSLYHMDDAKIRYATSYPKQEEKGLPDKHADIKLMPVTDPGKTFDDISAHMNQPAIEAMAARGIINGKTADKFDPDATMTRAEFAAIVVRALGLPQKTGATFTDVPSTEWYAPFIGSAFTYGIVTGTSPTTFNPAGTITRQEAAVMVARAAKLAGMDTYLPENIVRDILAQFGDYVTCAEWARPSLAACYNTDILSQEKFDIEPLEKIKRCEVAEMLFRMLGSAGLL